MSYHDYRAAEIAKHDEFKFWLLEDLLERGENRLGIEVKHDQKVGETGNLCIETAEKAYPRDGDYVPSGIYRDDNTVILAIGNKAEGVWVLRKADLRRHYETKSPRKYRTATSQGFLISRSQADRMCLWYVRGVNAHGAREHLFATDGYVGKFGDGRSSQI